MAETEIHNQGSGTKSQSSSGYVHRVSIKQRLDEVVVGAGHVVGALCAYTAGKRGEGPPAVADERLVKVLREHGTSEPKSASCVVQ